MEFKNIGVSVIICCYNSGVKLIPTLRHLASQRPFEGIWYEVIIVDNNCTDNTIFIASEEWRSLATNIPILFVTEKKAGLKFARKKGLEVSSFEYVVFCDDDNWLCDTYLKRVYQLFEHNDKVAIIGGIGEAVCEIATPIWFNLLDGFGYAIGKEGRENGLVDSAYGAGMAIRRCVMLELMNSSKNFILNGRTGNTLSSGEDIEMCFLVKEAGYDILFDDSLLFHHFLTSKRLTWSYYLKLRSSFGSANSYIQLYTLDHSLLENNINKSQFKQLKTIILYTIFNIKYLVFPNFFKNSICANFFQHWSFLKTCLFEKKALLKLVNTKILNIYIKPVPKSNVF